MRHVYYVTCTITNVVLTICSSIMLYVNCSVIALFCAGSPFEFDAFDLTKVIVSGVGLSSAQCHRMATFTIQTPESLDLSDLNVKITGEKD